MLKKTLAVLVLYLYIYNPIFVWPGFGFVLVLMALSSLYYTINYKSLLNYLSYYRTELLLSLIMVVYVPVVCLFNGTDGIPLGVELIKWIISTVFVPVFLVEKILSRIHINFFDTILFVGFIASIISCCALFYPPFNSFLRSIQDTREFTDYAISQFSFRYFGLGNNLSSAFGYVQGVLASLCLLRLDNNHKRYAIYFISLVISVVVNARTGLVPIFFTIGFIIIRLLTEFNISRLIKIGIVGIVVMSIISFLLKMNLEIYGFVADFFIQVDQLFFNSSSSIEESAYVTMIKFPESISGLLFGEGRSLFGAGDGEGSDIAYINQLFIGGLFFVSLLIIYEYVVYIKIKQMSKECVFSTIFFMSILIFNYKGVSFYTSSAFMKLWMLYYFVLVHNYRLHKPQIPL